MRIIKGILFICTLFVVMIMWNSASANHYHNNTNYNNNWDYNNSCNGGIYKGYEHWFLRDGQYTQSTKRISNWFSYVSIICNNWEISRKIL